MLKGPGGRSTPLVARRRLAHGVAAACALIAGMGAALAVASLGAGRLDPSFGTGGTTVLEHPTSTYPTPAALAPGGRIVVVSSSAGVITVSRLLADGAPDPAFNGGVPAVIDEAGAPSASAVAIQPDGKVVVAGSKRAGAEEKEEAAMVWRLAADGGTGAPNGALDPSFGSNGKTQIKTFTVTHGAAIAIQPDGKLVVVGSGFTGSNPSAIGIWRLSSTGNLDPEFGFGGGATEVSDGNADSASAVALAPDGKILIAGASESSEHRDAVVWRLKANGGAGEGLIGPRDMTFNHTGQANIETLGARSYGEGIALQPDGKILLAGSTIEPPSRRTATVWRLLPDGGPKGATNEALDLSFGGSGVAAIEGGGSAAAQAIALQPDGKILLAGSQGTFPNVSAAIWRLLPGGGNGVGNSALDPTFGTGGTAVASVASGAAASALALQPDRRIVAAGGTFAGKLLVFRALGDPFAVTVVKAGTGSGSAASSPPGIDCGAACSGLFDDGATVTLTPTPAPASTFVGWSGAGCGGTGTCALPMTADQTVTATFDATAPPPPHAMPTKATISALGESNSVFAVGPSPTPLSGEAASRRHKRGTVFSFRLDQPASVKIAIQRRTPGRRVRRGCRGDSRRLRHAPRCTRTVTVATLVRAGHAGLDRVPFTGRLGGRALAPGRYQAAFMAIDAAGMSQPKVLSFTIVRR